MTVNDAINLVRKRSRENVTIVVAREYSDCYAFFVAPPNSKISDGVFVGNCMICVDKNAKRVFWDEAHEIDSRPMHEYEVIDI